jgi:hypothetical protein
MQAPSWKFLRASFQSILTRFIIVSQHSVEYRYREPLPNQVAPMSNSTGYGYSPLGDNSIRLLQIEAVTNPSLNHERASIRCQIHHFHIAKAPNYRALSYACEFHAPLFNLPRTGCNRDSWQGTSWSQRRRLWMILMFQLFYRGQFGDSFYLLERSADRSSKEPVAGSVAPP